MAILAQASCCRSPEKEPQHHQIRVGGGTTMGNGLWPLPSVFSLRVLSNSFTLLRFSDKVRHKDIFGIRVLRNSFAISWVQSLELFTLHFAYKVLGVHANPEDVFSTNCLVGILSFLLLGPSRRAYECPH